MTSLHHNEHAKSLLNRFQEEGIEYVDLRFTDLRGTWHHLSVKRSALSLGLLQNGINFDGSSIAGWKSVDDSDMTLIPDCESVYPDPFSQKPTVVMFCQIQDPVTGDFYLRDPRSTAARAEAYLKETGIADRAFFGPEPEFFIFDHAEFECHPQASFYRLHGQEENLHLHTAFKDPGIPQRTYRPLPKGGYFPVSPIDSEAELRTIMLDTLEDMGVEGEKHHHEVAAHQHELGFTFNTLMKTSDYLQIFKYVIHNVAHQAGKTATFMPKPIYGDNGSGMHVHQSLWKGEIPLFAGNSYAGLSDLALYYIGGILKHAKALNAFTNPTTNSYKRLIPGYEAPVYLFYSARNRSAAIRIPHADSEKARRIEVRFPDPTANSYLALSSMLMAGLDGIINKIHPGDAMNCNIYDLKDQMLKPHQIMAASLEEALNALENDHIFLLQGNVFSHDQLHSYINLKRNELKIIQQIPHPKEFELYYNL